MSVVIQLIFFDVVSDVLDTASRVHFLRFLVQANTNKCGVIFIVQHGEMSEIVVVFWRLDARRNMTIFFRVSNRRQEFAQGGHS